MHVDIDVDIDIDLNHEYFSQEILEFNKKPTGKILKNAFSDFFFVNDGMIIGFKFYGGCDKTETLTNPPGVKKPYASSNICGAIFYDVWR